MSLFISCDQCSVHATSVCADCVVTFICRPPEEAVIIDADEQRAVRLLSRAGLVPKLRHQPRATCA